MSEECEMLSLGADGGKKDQEMGQRPRRALSHPGLNKTMAGT